jgi:hypothetical protein
MHDLPHRFSLCGLADLDAGVNLCGASGIMYNGLQVIGIGKSLKNQ